MKISEEKGRGQWKGEQIVTGKNREKYKVINFKIN